MNLEKLPGASNALTMGILSIVLTIFCCGPFGAIFSFIGLSSAKSAEKLHMLEPNRYIGYENAKTGRLLSYIGLALAVVYLVLTIIYFGLIIAIITTGNLEGF